jgi:4-hydroxyphenylpyruvate dioxygenase-like putative hemolysin
MNANPYAIMLSDPQPAAAGAKSGVKSPTSTPEDSFSESMPRVGSYDEEWMSFVEQHSMESCWAARDRTEADVLPRVWNMPRF